MTAQIVSIRTPDIVRKVTSLGRKANSAYRVHEHLTEAQMSKLLVALKHNRHGHRDWLIGLLIYRHGLRVSEACDLRWDDLALGKRTIIVRRLKGSDDSTHSWTGTKSMASSFYSANRKPRLSSVPTCSSTSAANRSVGPVSGV